MNNISSHFNRKKQILPYIMVGDGGVEASFQLLDLYVACGCSVIEIGVPFSDPAADGQTIQLSAKRALANDITISDCLSFIKEGKEKYPHVSFILMTYINPIISYGIDRFFDDLDAEGIIVPDMPYEEYELLYPAAQSANVSIIPLLTIDTNLERMKSILEKSSGFIYLITMKGITGTKLATTESSATTIENLRDITKLPIVAGFGIRNKEQVRDFHQLYDGVVIASQLIKYANEGSISAIESLLK